jgi:hypothetical protein
MQGAFEADDGGTVGALIGMVPRTSDGAYLNRNRPANITMVPVAPVEAAMFLSLRANLIGHGVGGDQTMTPKSSRSEPNSTVSARSRRLRRA